MASPLDSAGSTSTPNIEPPNYELWRNGLEDLLGDAEGHDLFKKYLTEDCLEHVLEFR